jgi:hypothetical protein
LKERTPIFWSFFSKTGSISSRLLVSRDWGLIKHLQAAAALHPTSVHEIAELVPAVASSSSTNLTVAAKGVGHSTNGLSQVCPGFFFCWIPLVIINSLSCLN